MKVSSKEPSPAPGLFSHVKADVPAGIIVFCVAVPLCLGIALASGAPLFSGLIAGILGGIVVGIASKSPLGVSGPAAGLAVIVLGAIKELGFEPFLLAVVLAGVVQIVLGLLGAGVLAYFVPSSVIKGMLGGIGVIILLKQIPHALGNDSDPEGDLALQQSDGGNTFSALITDIDPNAALIAGVSLFILILWETVLMKKHKVFSLIQGPLVVVVFGMLYQYLTSKHAPSMAMSESHLVSVPVAGNFSEFLGQFTTPDWSAFSDGRIYITAVTLAVVASLETLLCVEASDKLDPLKRVTPTGRELVAQGVGNSLSGLIGGLPITQVIIRSSANIQSGGRTKLSAIVHGFMMLIFVALFPSVLNLIPLAALAAILLVVGYKLAKPAVFVKMFSLGVTQFLPFIVTVVGIVMTDLLTGIGLGLAVAIVVILQRSYRNSHILTQEGENGDGQPQFTLQLAEEVTFLNKGAVTRELNGVPDGSHLRIDGSRCVAMDHDVLEVIQEFLTTVERREITIERVGEVMEQATA